jgi:hypothetical protein
MHPTGDATEGGVLERLVRFTVHADSNNPPVDATVFRYLSTGVAAYRTGVIHRGNNRRGVRRSRLRPRCVWSFVAKFLVPSHCPTRCAVMPRNVFRVFVAAAITAILAGCATTTDPAFASADAKPAQAPLGSRIKRATNMAPTSGVNREEIEQAKVQSGIIRTGIANDGR